jgi:hypothetical protein
MITAIRAAPANPKYTIRNNSEENVIAYYKFDQELLMPDYENHRVVKQNSIFCSNLIIGQLHFKMVTAIPKMD